MTTVLPFILIVEDNLFTAENIAEDLRLRGYYTQACGTPDEALQAISKSLPDLIIMDIDLKSEMDGIDLAARINASKRVPVVYLTQKTDDRVLEKVRKLHNAHYMNKPFKYSVLAHQVSLLLEEK